MTNKLQIELPDEIDHKINRYFYDIYWDKEIKFEYCMMAFDSEGSYISFGKTRSPVTVYIKYEKHIEKINDWYVKTVKAKDLPFTKEEADAIKNDIIAILPKEYQENHFLMVNAFGFGCIDVSLFNINDIDITKNRVEAYIENYGFVLDKDTVYKFRTNIYSKSNMIEVYLNDECIYGGNNWDFHNGCNGCDIPNFNGHQSYVRVLKNGLQEKGYKVETESVECGLWT